MEEKALVGIAAIMAILVVGAVLGRVHGEKQDQVKAIGDRVMCGLLSLPLISVCVWRVFPQSHIFWVLASPLPMALYTLLLAGTDMNWKFAKEHFVRSLLISVGITYVVMAVAAKYLP